MLRTKPGNKSLPGFFVCLSLEPSTCDPLPQAGECLGTLQLQDYRSEAVTKLETRRVSEDCTESSSTSLTRRVTILAFAFGSERLKKSQPQHVVKTVVSWLSSSGSLVLSSGFLAFRNFG